MSDHDKKPSAEFDLTAFTEAIKKHLRVGIEAWSIVAALSLTAKQEMGDETWRQWLQAEFPQHSNDLETLCNTAREEWKRRAAEKASELH